MKTSLRKYLSLVMVLCVAFVCLFAVNVSAADSTYSYEFSAKQYSANGSVELGDVSWTLAGDGGYWGYDSTKGQQFGSGSKPYTTMTLTSDSEFSNVQSITINTSGASSTAAKMTVLVGGVQVGSTTSLTKTATSYTFEPNGASGVVQFSYTQTSSKAIYVKSIEVVYSDEASTEPSVSLSGDSVTKVGTPITLVVDTQNTSSSVAWSSSDDTIATVSNGVVTPVSMGTVTITAALSSDATVFDEIDVNVWPNNNEPISIATAKEICDFTGANNSAFQYSIVGTIETIDYAYSSTSNNISVTLSDGTDTISLYKMTGGDDLSVGSKIKVTGYLCLYNSTMYEVNEGSTYEIVIDESLTTLIAALNDVQAYLSLGYKYVVTEEKVYYTVDTLNNATTGVSGTTYTEWTGKTANSNAVYAGQSAGGNSSIQLRSSNSNSGIVSTTSGGLVTKVTVTWNANTAAGRILDIYGSNTAYTSPTELYDSDSSLVGEKIGSIANGETTFVISGEYAYIGVRSNSGALYLDSIEFTWVDDSYEDSTSINTYTYVDFRIRVGVDSSIANLEGIDAWGIRVASSNGTTKEYLVGNEYIYSEGNYYYVVISLDDVLNNSERLSVEFTVEAFIVIDDVNYYSSQSKTYSVAGMVQKYYEEDGNVAVEGLYNELVAMGKIA